MYCDLSGNHISSESPFVSKVKDTCSEREAMKRNSVPGVEHIRACYDQKGSKEIHRIQPPPRATRTPSQRDRNSGRLITGARSKRPLCHWSEQVNARGMDANAAVLAIARLRREKGASDEPCQLSIAIQGPRSRHYRWEEAGRCSPSASYSEYTLQDCRCEPVAADIIAKMLSRGR